MSDTVPQFHVGDQVRMMQTPLSVKTGMANKRGVVVEVKPKGYVMVDFDSFGQILCNPAHLMAAE